MSTLGAGPWLLLLLLDELAVKAVLAVAAEKGARCQMAGLRSRVVAKGGPSASGTNCSLSSSSSKHGLVLAGVHGVQGGQGKVGSVEAWI